MLKRLPLSAYLKSDPFPRFVGYLGFDAGRAFDSGILRLPVRPNALKTPAFLFGDYRAVVKIDFLKKTTTVVWRGKSKIAFARLVQRVALHLKADPSPLVGEGRVRGHPSSDLASYNGRGRTAKNEKLRENN